jgi:tetratricopeptide (TPR) repeat protein
LVLAAVASVAASQGDPREALQNAAALVQQGRLDEAERQARLALAADETRAVAYSVLGTIRFQQQRLEESVTFLRKAVSLAPDLPGAHLSLAQVYTLQRRPELAEPLYTRVLQLDPTNATARLALVRAKVERGEHREALTIAQPILPAFKQSHEDLFVLATALLKTGDRSAAAALAKDWTQLENVPQEWSARFGMLLATEGLAAPAVEVLAGASRRAAPSYELAFNLAGAYLLDRQPARALEAYDVALGLRPDSVPALLQAAAVAERQGELERSLAYWIRAKKIQPEDPAVLLGFGRVCLRMDLLEDAEPALEKAASLKPGEPAYLYTLAAAKVGKRQFDAAQRLLEALVEKRPQDPQLQYALGSILYIQGNLDDAAARLRESLRLQPEQLASNYYLALVLRDQGNEAEAIVVLERLRQRHPDHAASCEALGGLLVSARRYGEAESLLRAAIRLNPKSVKANYQLGLLLARLGKKEESEKQLALAKSLREEDEATSRLQLRLLDPGL